MESYNIIKKELRDYIDDEEMNRKLFEKKLLLDEKSYRCYYDNHIALKAMRNYFKYINYDIWTIKDKYFKANILTSEVIDKLYMYDIERTRDEYNLKVIMMYYARIAVQDMLQLYCCKDIAKLIMEYV